jgi:NADH:ubiquinone oxidoreductase subunit 2 (subunit N)
MAAVAFGMIMLLARAGFEAEEIDDFKGLNRRNPWYAGVMAAAMFSLAGVPPLIGFFAKLMVLKAAIDAGQLWLAIVAIVFAIVCVLLSNWQLARASEKEEEVQRIETNWDATPIPLDEAA